METAGESDRMLVHRASTGHAGRSRAPATVPSTHNARTDPSITGTDDLTNAARRLILSVAVVGALTAALTGCSGAPATVASSTPAPSPTPTPTATSHLSTYPTPRDQGPFDGAEGTTTTDSSGKITYTVVSGDSASTIATRFGVYPEQVETLVGGKVGMSTIHPGDKLQFGTRGYT